MSELVCKVDGGGKVEKAPQLQATWSSQGEAVKASKRRSFFDLPTETRVQIYKSFADLPVSDQAFKPNTYASRSLFTTALDRERLQLIATRGSLRLVCRQICFEWSPVFYATTTFELEGEGAKNLTRFENALRCYPAFYGLRRLSYELTVGDRLSYLWFKTEEVSQFASFLRRHIKSLDSLQEIILSANARHVISVVVGTDASSWENLWDGACGTDLVGSDWEHLCRYFQDYRAYNAEPLLRGWSAARRMKYAKCELPEVDGTPATHYDVSTVQVVFRKPGTSAPPAAASWVELPWEDPGE
ncbi:hypothetical protein H2200_003112 [Cladophialophora chaetospira]|uniref:Uncharacterized protein n=1 Tax=Cladophialophora chaetospira TaxID=386627 RepID=A0AA38XHF9_9EURO|nr:hypothetical protein H2200_003112 [Cladophialophora chaetospira]